MYLWAYLCILLVWATVAAEGSLEVPRIHVDRQKVWSKLPLTPFAQSARETVILSSSIDNSNLKVPTSTKSAASLGVILPWLYFLCSSINLTTLPKYVNYAINGNTEVSPQSAQVYGLMGGLDALFTFLSVNYVGILSDRYVLL